MGSRTDDNYWNDRYEEGVRVCRECESALDPFEEDYCAWCEPEEEEEE